MGLPGITTLPSLGGSFQVPTRNNLNEEVPLGTGIGVIRLNKALADHRWQIVRLSERGGINFARTNPYRDPHLWLRSPPKFRASDRGGTQDNGGQTADHQRPFRPTYIRSHRPPYNRVDIFPYHLPPSGPDQTRPDRKNRLWTHGRSEPLPSKNPSCIAQRSPVSERTVAPDHSRATNTEASKEAETQVRSSG